MEAVHLLRPWWLAALPVGLWLIWRLVHGRQLVGRWRAVVDPGLQPHVLAVPRTALGAGRLPLLAAALAWALATLALAGPTWERVSVPVFRADEALVVALDLSQSMDATDLLPSRLARARLKLLSLLDRRRSGETALVVFSGHAFTATPLTSDVRTIGALLGSLSSDIMPSRGSRPEAGLTKAAELLRQTGLSRGEILLVTDGGASAAALAAARELSAAGMVVHVLAAGTEEGGPIRQAGGGFLTDDDGRMVIPEVDVASLAELASAGGGRFAVLSPDERDLDVLFPPDGTQASLTDTGERAVGRDAQVWRDGGAWLALGILPFAALAFRRGWVAVVAAALLVPMPRAEALDWADLWQRPDQRGQRAMARGEHEQAAELFRDPQWRAAAQYRSGDFVASAATLEGIDTAEAHYNRGNALARAGDLDGAVAAYQRTLELDPGHEDARHNRDVLLDVAPPQGRASAETENGEAATEGGQSGDTGEEASAAEQPRQAGATPQEEAGDPTSGDPPTAGDIAGEGDDQPRERPFAPEELEQWASDQAAEQWLRRIPQDPGGLLRRKFLYQYQRMGVDQEGNAPPREEEPW
jgi:Ca-activated chloride channel family protein